MRKKPKILIDRYNLGKKNNSHYAPDEHACFLNHKRITWKNKMSSDSVKLSRREIGENDLLCIFFLTKFSEGITPDIYPE